MKTDKPHSHFVVSEWT